MKKRIIDLTKEELELKAEYETIFGEEGFFNENGDLSYPDHDIYSLDDFQYVLKQYLELKAYFEKEVEVVTREDIKKAIDEYQNAISKHYADMLEWIKESKEDNSK